MEHDTMTPYEPEDVSAALLDLWRCELAELLAIHPDDRTVEDQINATALAHRLEHGTWKPEDLGDSDGLGG